MQIKATRLRSILPRLLPKKQIKLTSNAILVSGVTGAGVKTASFDFLYNSVNKSAIIVLMSGTPTDIALIKACSHLKNTSFNYMELQSLNDSFEIDLSKHKEGCMVVNIPFTAGGDLLDTAYRVIKKVVNDYSNIKNGNSVDFFFDIQNLTHFYNCFESSVFSKLLEDSHSICLWEQDMSFEEDVSRFNTDTYKHLANAGWSHIIMRTQESEFNYPYKSIAKQNYNNFSVGECAIYKNGQLVDDSLATLNFPEQLSPAAV